MAKIKGLSSLQKVLKDLDTDGEKAVQKAIDRTAELIEADAKANAPVRNGALKASIFTQRVPLLSKVGTDCWEAPYIEFGTRGAGLKIPKGWEDYAMQFIGAVPGNTPAQPYLFPALFKNQDKLVIFTEEEIDKILKKVK